MTRHKKVTRRARGQQDQQFTPVSSKIQTTKLIKPVNSKQRDYIDSIKKNVVSIILGSAGVGKSLIALSEACKLINSEDSPINKIFYLRSNIGMSHEDSLGSLPGLLSEKILPLAYPVLDNLIEFMSEGNAKYLIESGKIEVLPISMVRGRSFANSFIISDECQNLSKHHIRTILTRISNGSKMVLLGDTSQCDFKDTSISGINEVANNLKGTEGVGVVTFTNKEIIRHPIIGHILDRI